LCYAWSMTTFILIHSPLVGPMTWSRAAESLQHAGHQTLVPTLSNTLTTAPYWQQHAQSVAQAIASGQVDGNPVLVGHSGAGPLLPAIRAALNVTVAAYLFVDAGLPQNNKSRLEMFDSPEEVARFRAAAVNGLVPPWTANDLREVIPDDDLRQRFAAELELRPMPLAVYEERLPVFTGWPDAPCGCLQFSPAYDSAAHEAQARGWPYRKLASGHFHMLVAPEAVTAALLDLTHEMGIQPL
jgi:Alpha/beta hydrolase family